MRALAEIGAMAQKAALGAGIPLGQAEDLGRVAVYLAGSGGDLGVVADALTQAPDPIDVQWGSDQITVVAGPVALIGPIVRDAFAMGVVRAIFGDMGQVPLVVAMLAQAGIAVRLTDKTIVRDGVVTPAEPVGPVPVPDALWAVFESFAAKTYVPESEASRAGGAGAGLTDND